MAKQVDSPLYIEVRKFKVRESQDAASSGPLEIVIGTPNPGSYWFVERIAIRTNSTTATDFTVLVGDDPQKGTDWTAMMDHTGCVAANATDESPPIFVNTGEQLKFHWIGMTAGDTVWTNVQISERVLVNAGLPTYLQLDRFGIQLG